LRRRPCCADVGTRLYIRSAWRSLGKGS
jgi:hypothetical protein